MQNKVTHFIVAATATLSSRSQSLGLFASDTEKNLV